MTGTVSASVLSAFSHFVAEQMGLHFPPERTSDLQRGIARTMLEFGIKDSESCIRWLTSAPLTRKQIEVLASNLTVGETYFFRDKRTFEILKESILPELIRARQTSERRLRIWSAGCCTGEEPYSIAILLDQLLPGLEHWEITILGTDVNPDFLERAAHGVFGGWSFRDGPPGLQKKYFREIGTNRFEILPRIRKMVTFEYLNLAEDVYPSLITNTNAMDLILCRNVLMYFTADTTRRVIHNFYRSLLEKGSLIVSPAEMSHQIFSRFASRQYDGAMVYTKSDKSSSIPFDAVLEPGVAITSSRETAVSASGFTIAATSSQPAAETNAPQPVFFAEELSKFEHEGQALRQSETRSTAQEPVEGSVAMARNCADLGNLSAAQSWAEQAVATDKLSAGAHYLRALILEERGDHDEAAVSLRRALYLQPEFVLAHFALGNLALRQRSLKQAMKHLKNAQDLLEHYHEDEVLPESDGMPAGWLRKMIEVTLSLQRTA